MEYSFCITETLASTQHRGLQEKTYISLKTPEKTKPRDVVKIITDARMENENMPLKILLDMVCTKNHFEWQYLDIDGYIYLSINTTGERAGITEEKETTV